MHIHDNFGARDEHLLPFDGSIDWKWAMSNLKKAGFNRELTMEIVYHGQYPEMMTVEEFYRKGHEIGMKLAQMFEEAE